MRASSVLTGAVFVATTCAQSIDGLGVSGGNGPHGGVGDVENPVLTAQAIITDAIVLPVENATRLLAAGDPPIIASPEDGQICPPPHEVLIDSSPRGARQQMVGFGHAWTDSTVQTFASLEPDVLDQVMKDLFSQDGNNMGFMRHTIGSSDLSYNQYSFDDNGPSFNEGEPDLNLDNFTLGPDGSAMAAMIARMGQYKGDVFLYGSPWSFPGWMKNNALLVAPNLNVPNTYNILNNSFNIQYIPQMVKYFTKYLDTYKNDYGVSVNGLTLMNEPLNYQGGYPCMYLDAADEAAILTQGLGVELQQRNVLAMAYDHNTDQPVYPYRVLQSAREHVRGTAWHCYQSPVANYSVLEDLHYAYSDVLQFMTECTTYLPKPGSLNFGVPQNFIAPVQHGASGASMWVMATDPDYGPHSPYGGCAGCLGSIIVNSSTTYTKTLDYYMIGQFSRYIRRGAVNHQILTGNVGSTADSHQLLIMAAQNPDQSWAVVFMNNLNSTQDVRLSFTEGGRTWQGTIPNATVVTWLLPADERCPPSPPVYSSSSVSASTVSISTSAASSPSLPTSSSATSTLMPTDSSASTPISSTASFTTTLTTSATTTSSLIWSASAPSDAWPHGPPSSEWSGTWPPHGQPSWSWSPPVASPSEGEEHHWPARDSPTAQDASDTTSFTCPVTTTSSASSSSSSSSTTPLVPVPNTTHVVMQKEL